MLGCLTSLMVTGQSSDCRSNTVSEVLDPIQKIHFPKPLADCQRCCCLKDTKQSVQRSLLSCLRTYMVDLLARHLQIKEANLLARQPAPHTVHVCYSMYAIVRTNSPVKLLFAIFRSCMSVSGAKSRNKLILPLRPYPGRLRQVTCPSGVQVIPVHD